MRAVTTIKNTEFLYNCYVHSGTNINAQHFRKKVKKVLVENQNKLILPSP